MSESLKDKVAIVTGGGTGIGRGTALALAQVGCAVVVSGRRRRPLDATVEEIRSAGGQALAVQADVADEVDADRLVQAAVDRFGRLDILINNAGVYLDWDSATLPVDRWDQTLAINLRGPFLLMRAALPMFRKQRSGHIINISSESGLIITGKMLRMGCQNMP